MSTAPLQRMNVSQFALPAQQTSRQKNHSLARWLLLNLPEEKRADFIKKSGAVDTLKHYLQVHARALQCHQIACDYPKRKPVEPFLFHWQSALDEIGAQFADITARDGKLWNASNPWELCLKPRAQLAALAQFLDADKQRLLCAMATLESPVDGVLLCEQLGCEVFDYRPDWRADYRVLMFNLFATFTGF